MCDISVHFFCEFYCILALILPLVTHNQYINWHVCLVWILAFIFISEKVSSCRNFRTFSQCIGLIQNCSVGTLYMEFSFQAYFEENASFLWFYRQSWGKTILTPDDQWSPFVVFSSTRQLQPNIFLLPKIILPNLLYAISKY